MSLTHMQRIRHTLAHAERIYSEQDIDAAYDRMAAAITSRLGDSNPLVLCVMVGGLIPAGQLLPRLLFPLQIDYLHATRYQDTTQGGELNWIVRPRHSLENRVVLLIDDILDEGITLAALCDACHTAGAREVHTAVLLDKVHDRKNGLKATFTGLEVQDRYVFGCGMDYQGYWRNLPGIYAIAEE